jgi:hypothetical protein
MTVYGWDMSHYDGAGIGNAVSQGISFITHKAGGDANDQELGAWWSGVRNLPESVLLGAYWVLYPGTPAARADTFLARLDAVCPGWRNRDAFILQIDAEIWGGDTSTRPSIAECNAFAARLEARTDHKYVPVGYLPKWVYGDVSAFRYPVWASSYVSGSGGFKALYPGDTSSKWNGYGRSVSILQYSSSASIGGQSTCDANAYRGTITQLKALVTPSAIPPAAEDSMSAEDGKQGTADAFAAAAASISSGDAWGRQFRDNVNAVIDFSTAAGPLKDILTAQAVAIGDLTALVVQQTSASAQEIAAALAPLLGDVSGASPDEVEARIRKVLGSLNDV